MQAASSQLVEAVHIPVRLSGGEIRRLMEGDEEMEQNLGAGVRLAFS